MKVTKQAHTFISPRSLLIGIICLGLILSGIGYFYLQGGVDGQIAQAQKEKDTLSYNFDIYSQSTQQNISYLSDLRNLFDTTTSITSSKANAIDENGRKLKNQLAQYQLNQNKFKPSDNSEIEIFTRDINANLKLQELYIRNAIETVVYFTCMVEKKSQFNIHWQVFEAEFSDGFTPTINNLSSQESINYFLSFAATARKSADSLKDFNFCFEDTFYTFKNSSFDTILQKSEEDLLFVASLYEQFASLVVQDGVEEELIATIEAIESVDLEKLQLIKNDFDSAYIILPSKKIFDETVSFSFIEKQDTFQSRYESIESSL